MIIDRILRVLDTQTFKLPKEVAKELKVSVSTARQYMTKMTDQGLLEREYDRNTTTWRFTYRKKEQKP